MIIILSYIQNSMKFRQVPFIKQQQMSEQITLLDVCKLPDVQIHSKTSFFKHIISRENPEMQKLRENIVKLSYTNKIIGVKDEQVGIISKRLPLRFKDSTVNPKHQNLNLVLQNAGYIPQNNFYVEPLSTIRKCDTETKKQGKKTFQIKEKHVKIVHNLEAIGITKNLNLAAEDLIKQSAEVSSKGFRSKSQSMIRLRAFEKKQSPREVPPTRKTQDHFRSIQSRSKSFSNLLKDLKINNRNNILFTPITHEQNTLFKRYQHLAVKSSRKRSTKQNDQSKIDIDESES